MAKPKRQKVRKIVPGGAWGRYISPSDFEGTPDEIIKVAQGLKEEFADRVIELELENIPYDDRDAFFVYEVRDETDAEFAERLDKEKKQRDAIETRERAELARLQAIYAQNEK